MGFRCDSSWVGKGSSLDFQQVVDQPKRSPYEKVMAQTVQHGPSGRGGSGIEWALAQIYSNTPENYRKNHIYVLRANELK